LRKSPGKPPQSSAEFRYDWRQVPGSLVRKVVCVIDAARLVASTVARVSVKLLSDHVAAGGKINHPIAAIVHVTPNCYTLLGTGCTADNASAPCRRCYIDINHIRWHPPTSTNPQAASRQQGSRWPRP